jgi:succinate dehydrogenase hydrophobic anchor subunit
VDLGLIVGVLFHSGYGLLSVAKDYIPSKLLQNTIAFVIIVVMVVFGWVGVKLTISI